MNLYRGIGSECICPVKLIYGGYVCSLRRHQRVHFCRPG